MLKNMLIEADLKRHCTAFCLATSETLNQLSLLIRYAIKRLKDVKQALSKTDAPPCLTCRVVFLSAWL